MSMPTLDRLAKNGLTYTQWHTTAVCSPTRSCFLTGRNHHQNGFGSIAESAVGFPGYSGHIPLENATIATVLRDAGWSTFWVGKNHNVPVDAFDMGVSKKRWPLGPRLRPLLRLHRRRDQPVVSRADRGQPLRRAAVPARGRLSLLQGHRRQGDPLHPRHASSRSPTSPGTCGTAPAPITRRTTRPRTTSTSTRASSTTATRRIASGCWRE